MRSPMCESLRLLGRGNAHRIRGALLEVPAVRCQGERTESPTLDTPKPLDGWVIPRIVWYVSVVTLFSKQSVCLRNYSCSKMLPWSLDFRVGASERQAKHSIGTLTHYFMYGLLYVPRVIYLFFHPVFIFSLLFSLSPFFW